VSTEPANGIAGRVAGTTRISADQRTERPPFPKKAKIEVTSRCDLKCFFCQHTYDARPKGDIDPELMRRLLRDLRAVGVEEIGLFWIGEPLLNPDLPEYVGYAKSLGFPYVFVTTNGRLATLDRIGPLFDAGLDSIKFSFNADSPESYRRVCGVDGFDRTMANLKTAWEYRAGRPTPAIYASTVQIPGRETDYERTRRLILPYVDQHYPLRLYGERALDGEAQIVDAPGEARRRLASMLPCWSLFTEPHISFDGQMSACFCDHDQRLYMGDLTQVSPLEAWHSEKFVALRRRHLAGDVTDTVCQGCIAYHGAA
jgi:pyruvate-formate lyase-activating enzyme